MFDFGSVLGQLFHLKKKILIYRHKKAETSLGDDSAFFVRITGLEPARLGTLEPKSSASANSAISACFCYKTRLIILPFSLLYVKQNRKKPTLFVLTVVE